MDYVHPMYDISVMHKAFPECFTSQMYFKATNSEQTRLYLP